MAGSPPKASKSSWWWDVLRSYGPAILVIILIRTFVFEPYRIPSGSMVPTLLIGDHVLVSKSSYGIWIPWTGIELIDVGDPERGDIIVFRYPRDPSMTYIKRVVAVPGDKIKVRANQIFIDGEAQARDLVGPFEFVDDRCNATPSREFVEHLGSVPHRMLTNTGGGGFLSNASEIEVPPDNVFVMGDNRDHSEDSRRWGFVRFDQIKGKAHLVWFSWDGCSGGFGSVRPGRFFQGLYSLPEGVDASQAATQE